MKGLGGVKMAQRSGRFRALLAASAGASAPIVKALLGAYGTAVRFECWCEGVGFVVVRKVRMG